MMGELFAFAVVMAIGQFSPGPDMLLLTRTSLVEGLRAGWIMVLGIVSGLALHGVFAIGGMAVLISNGGMLASGMRWLAAIYLIWLAMGLVKKQPSDGDIVIPKRSPYLRGLFCNLLNPKVLVFLASVVAPFLSEGQPPWWPVALWITIVVEGVILWFLWVWLLQVPKIRQAYLRVGRQLDLVFALVLVLLAINLLR